MFDAFIVGKLEVIESCYIFTKVAQLFKIKNGVFDLIY